MHRPELSISFGPYVTESVLGSGQFGTVYSARHAESNQTVALKVLDPALVNDTKVRRRFVREGYASRRFDHHNVVRCLDASETHAARPWIAFELIRGVTLARLLQEPVALARRLGWLNQILAGIRHMHNRGAVHRDIKPANLMMEVDGEGRDRVVIVDLGLTHFADLESVSAAEEGTPSHLAPELVVAGAHPTIQSDLYSIGVVLFQMLEDRLPYDGTHGVAVALQQVTEPVPKLSERLQPKERRRWQAVIDRVLAKEPRHRFATADEFRAALPEPDFDFLSDQELTGPSDFSLAIDAALVSARHSEETVEQVVLHTNVEQWIYRDAWDKCLKFLGRQDHTFGIRRLVLRSSRSGEAERFAYHLIRSVRSEGYYDVLHPYCELESDQLDARRVGSDEVPQEVPEFETLNRPTLIALLGKTNMLGDYLAEVAQRSKQTNAAIVILMTNSEERGELDIQLSLIHI